MNDSHFIYMLPMGNINGRFLETLRLNIEYQLDLPCRLMEPINLPEYAYDSERWQYNSLEILKLILNLSPKDAIKILGLCNIDLYIPIQNFIFGQAQFNGLAAIVSMRRLNGEYHGEACGEALIFRRTLKEVMHELGHAFGLIHCHSPRCVMSQSINVEQVDQKEIDFCDECQTFIGQHIMRWKLCWAEFYRQERSWWWTTRRSFANLSRAGSRKMALK
ncbi:MAG: archaemetzincin family Zn-dependent metalloprotease [Deltaproteobacteria bacterium]|nr:archaemetzincin family Zn-dependent metalloprotease [Deltaproteobacteria bacterium]MBW2308969.1 archaemetzincin family Zn-dependent metalloprotease [Deltaproteobacteria bacterium]